MQTLELVVPTSTVDGGLGFAFDIGATMCKLVYKSKETLPNHDHCKLCFATMPAAQMADCLKLLKENAAVDPPTSNKLLHTTGISVRNPAIRKAILDEYHVQIENLMETICYFDAFMFLVTNFAKDVVVLPPSKKAYEEGVDMGKQWMRLLQPEKTFTGDQLQTSVEQSPEPYATTDKDLFPCLLVTVGTGGSFNLVRADGSFQLVDGTERAGKYLMGLSSLMLDIRNYDELMALAEQGEESQVTDYMRELKSGETGDFYDIFPDDVPIFHLGKAATKSKDHFKPRDIARALVASFTMSLVRHIYWVGKAHGCGRVFVGGGVFSHSLMRDEFTKDFLSASVSLTANQELDMEMYFLQHGIYMSALGALLHNHKHYQQESH